MKFRIVVFLFLITAVAAKYLYLISEEESLFHWSRKVVRKHPDINLWRQLLSRDSPLSYNGVHHLLKSVKQPFPANKNNDEEIPTELEMKDFTFIASPLVRSIDTLILSCRQIFMKYPDTKIKIMSTLIEFLNTPESWSTTSYGSTPRWDYTSGQKDAFMKNGCISNVDEENSNIECSLWEDSKRCKKNGCTWNTHHRIWVKFMEYVYATALEERDINYKWEDNVEASIESFSKEICTNGTEITVASVHENWLKQFVIYANGKTDDGSCFKLALSYIENHICFGAIYKFEIICGGGNQFDKITMRCLGFDGHTETTTRMCKDERPIEYDEL